jgi:hypothetical protein
LSSSHSPAVRFDGGRQKIAGSDQDAFILRQPRQKTVRGARQTQDVRVRQGFAVGLHLVAAEKLRSQRRLGAREFLGHAVSAKACPPSDQGFTKGPAVHLQIQCLLLKLGSVFENEPMAAVKIGPSGMVNFANNLNRWKADYDNLV